MRVVREIVLSDLHLNLVYIHCTVLMLLITIIIIILDSTVRNSPTTGRNQLGNNKSSFLSEDGVPLIPRNGNDKSMQYSRKIDRLLDIEFIIE